MDSIVNREKNEVVIKLCYNEFCDIYRIISHLDVTEPGSFAAENWKQIGDDEIINVSTLVYKHDVEGFNKFFKDILREWAKQ